MPPARPAPVNPRRRVRTPLARPHRVTVRAPKLRVRWDRAGRIGLLVVLGVVVALYVQHTLAYLSTRSQANQQQAIVSRLQRANTALERQQRSLSDPAVIVRDARALGMVRPGERPYVIPGLASH
jgi:cell division protein FtsB